jgi:signal transduction histidine kinase
MLSVARLESGESVLKKSEFDFYELLCTIIISQEQRIEEKRLDIVGLDSMQATKLNADKDLLYQVVYNLVDNAIKYSDGKVIVKLTRENNKTIALSVYNTGSNIPEKDANRIFERFYRGENSRSRELGGSGLGLSIAKSIADANKWKIYAESVMDKSMTITVLMKTKTHN